MASGDDPDRNIVAENIRIMGPMILAALFEELKAFEVVDRIVEQFQRGALPIGTGNAGRKLHEYWRDAANRMSERERRDFHAIALGIVGGDPRGTANLAFHDLWLQFVSSAASFARKDEAGATRLRRVRKAARDLAGNLSRHGVGPVRAAARRMQAQMDVMMSLLQDPEILNSYGARDMWQVVDRIAADALGGAKSSARHRRLATLGTTITAWLADNTGRIDRARGPLIDIEGACRPDAAPTRGPSRKPTDHDLVNACERWLADTGASEGAGRNGPRRP